MKRSMDLLRVIQSLPYAPPLFREELLAQLGEKVDPPDTEFPTPKFALKQRLVNNKVLPQVIAHRGHKAKYPENTLQAFEAAVEAGAHGLETDLHLSKDGVVVLSHDADLKRCFGEDRLVRDCDWEHLSTLRTTKEPSQPLPCLQDLLELFRRPQWKNTWLMLDIKTDNEPREMMRHLSDVFKRVHLDNGTDWKDKVLVGIWAARYLPLCHEYLPGFPVLNIGFCLPYARQFLGIPGASISMLVIPLVSPSGRNLIRQAQARDRPVYAWTVNHEKNVDWCIRRQIDGIITDDIPKVLQQCETFGQQKRYTWPLNLALSVAIFNFWLFLFGLVLRRRYGSVFGNTTKFSKKKN